MVHLHTVPRPAVLPGNNYLYSATCQGTDYLSVGYHRGRTSADKSAWSIGRGEEFALFQESECKRWIGHDRANYGTLRNAQAAVGTEGEIVAKFPPRTNRSDPRHGYPMTLDKSRGDVVPDEVVTLWEDTGHVEWGRAQLIRKAKI